MRVIDTMASRWDAMPSGNESWPLGSPGSWDAVGNCGAVTVATVCICQSNHRIAEFLGMADEFRHTVSSLLA